MLHVTFDSAFNQLRFGYSHLMLVDEMDQALRVALLLGVRVRNEDIMVV